MKDIREYLYQARLVASAELSSIFGNTKYPSLRQQAMLLAQRSATEINVYLSMRAYNLRIQYEKTRIINHEELYVVSFEETEETFGCAYMYGKTYHSPPIHIPPSYDLKDIWEYLLKCCDSYAACSFQEFFEKRILKALQSISLYEDTLRKEIVPLEYALCSNQGVAIHNVLTMLATETFRNLQEELRLFKKNKAPQSLLNENSNKLITARQIRSIIERAKPRTT